MYLVNANTIFLKEVCSNVEVGLSSQVTEIRQEVMALICYRGGSGWILRKFIFRKSDKALEQASQGSGEVTVPGSVQETCRCGTEGYG